MRSGALFGDSFRLTTWHVRIPWPVRKATFRQNDLSHLFAFVVVECLLEVYSSKNLKLVKGCKKLLRKRMELWSAVDVVRNVSHFYSNTLLDIPLKVLGEISYLWIGGKNCAPFSLGISGVTE